MLNFFDVLLVKRDESIETRWFRKASNTLRFSAYDSMDSKIYKVSLIYTMVNKISKICLTQQFYSGDLGLLKHSFIESGYPVKLVYKHFDRAVKSFSKSLFVRDNRMNTNGQQEHKTCYFGLYYRSFRTELFMDRLKRLVKQYFPETKLMTFYRHGPNLLSKFSSRIKSKNNYTETGIYKIPCKTVTNIT